jgi:diguanylate cyclase (GGDEF)-like protein
MHDSGSSRQARQVVPFLAAATLAFLLVALTARVHAWGFTAAAGLGLVAWAAWARLPSSAQIVPSLLFLGSAAMLRHAGGGNGSGVGVLALLPVFWIALHGSPRQLAILLAGVALFYLAPIVLIGGGEYPESGFRTAILFTVVSGLIGFTVQQLVAQVRGQAQEAERHWRDLDHVTSLSRQIAVSADARVNVCRAACELSGARYAVLLEPDGDRLRSTAMVGLDAVPFDSKPAGERSAPRTALSTRRSIFVPDPATSSLVNHQLWLEHGAPACMLFEPVLRGDTAAGVLDIGWDEPIGEARHTAVIRLLATEAAIAIERADLVEQLNGLAMTDPLTGVDNRRAWDAQLHGALTLARPQCRPVSVAMLDLDHFKAFNDARGHQDGDRLLKEAASAWRDELRPGDRLARYGGEEFVVLLPDCTEASAFAVIERLREATPAGQTCSAGVAQWDGTESAEALVGRADAALYVAKGGGRDRTVAAA